MGDCSSSRWLVQLGENIRDVTMHGVLADPEVAGYPFVVETIRYQLQNLPLSR